MHFFSRNKALIAASVVAMGALAACGDDVTVPAAVNPPVVINITPQNRAMNIGETVNFAVQISGGSTTTPPTLASCTSDNAAVATASVQGNACRVVAVAAGNVNVTAAASTGQSAAAAITVNAAADAISNLSVSPTSANLSRGQTVTIVPNVQKGAPGNTVTYSYVSSSPAIATVNATTGVVTAVAPGTATITVTATGSGTGFSNATLTQGVTVNVVEAPPSVTSVTVTPTALALAQSETRQVSATVNTAAGAPASTITYSSTNTAIASVSATGVVTGVAAGNATINVRVQNAGTGTLAAYDNTFAVPVTVQQPANLSIVEIRQGPHVSMDSSTQGVGIVTEIPNLTPNAPADILNTRDQIQVVLDVSPNGQRVDSVVVYIQDVASGTLTRAERHAYTGASDGTTRVEIPINTAEFTVNFAAGTADTRYKNGQKRFFAKIYARNSSDVSSEGLTADLSTQFTFNNFDGWTTDWNQNLPSRVAQGGVGSVNNLNWYGGPGTAGRGTYTIVPVIYTAGRSVRTATTAIDSLTTTNIGSTQTYVCGTNVYTEAGTPLPWKSVYGSTGLTDRTMNCGGYEHVQKLQSNAMPLNAPVVSNAIDNYNQGFPQVWQPRGWRRASTVTRPTAIRLDYRGPSVSVSLAPQVTGAEAGWVNGVFSFVSATSASDAAVGLPGTGIGRTYAWTGCTDAGGNGGTNVSFDGLVKPAGTAGEIPECINNPLGGALFNGPFTVTATQIDVLENSGSTTSQRFGVDKTNPQVQLADEQSLTAAAVISRMPNAVRVNADSIFDNVTTTFVSASGNVNSTNALFGTRYRDERSGFRQDNHGSRSITRWSPNPSPVLTNVSVVSEVIAANWRTLNFDGAVTPQESVIDAGDPTYRRDSIAIFGNAAGQSATSPGYYFYRITVVDRAGNSTTRTRTAAIDITSPQITGVTIPAVLQGGANITFNPTGVDDLEAIDGDLFLNYPTMATGGDNVADPTVIADQNGRLRFRRNLFTNWHEAFAGATRNTVQTLSDGLLSTPFGPAAALSSGGLTMPVGFYQRLEVVQVAPANSDQGPHGRAAFTRLPSAVNLAAIPAHAAWTAHNNFKATMLGVYAFDIRATSAVNFPNNGMSNDQSVANESAYTEPLFAANITQPAAGLEDFWAKKDVDPITSGQQVLLSWYCFSFIGSTLECRAETDHNVAFSPFARVDFYRWKAAANANLAPAGDAAATAGQWIYVGQVAGNYPVNPTLSDHGTWRTWHFRFGFAGFGTTGNQAANTEAAFGAGDRVRAIGVDAQGNAISTLTFTL